MKERIEATIRIARDHPALPGHFPGAPVVPAVVLLDALLEAAEVHLGRALCVAGVPRAKFLAQLLPETDAQAVLEIEAARPDRLEFRVEQGGQILAQGAFALLAKRAP